MTQSKDGSKKYASFDLTNPAERKAFEDQMTALQKEDTSQVNHKPARSLPVCPTDPKKEPQRKEVKKVAPLLRWVTITSAFEFGSKIYEKDGAVGHTLTTSGRPETVYIDNAPMPDGSRLLGELHGHIGYGYVDFLTGSYVTTGNRDHAPELDEFSGKDGDRERAHDLYGGDRAKRGKSAAPQNPTFESYLTVPGDDRVHVYIPASKMECVLP